MAEYTLPDLDWDYGALEPHISGQINELHHSKHHATYVKGANDAVTKLEEARAKEDHSTILLNEKNLAFNLAGHVNHTIWWKNLSPNGGDKPPVNSPRPSMRRSGRSTSFGPSSTPPRPPCRGRVGQRWAGTPSATSC